LGKICSPLKFVLVAIFQLADLRLSHGRLMPRPSPESQFFHYSDEIAESGFPAKTRIEFAETLPSNNGFNFWLLLAFIAGRLMQISAWQTVR
jgi:hypothetical protein